MVVVIALLLMLMRELMLLPGPCSNRRHTVPFTQMDSKMMSVNIIYISARTEKMDQMFRKVKLSSCGHGGC